MRILILRAGDNCVELYRAVCNPFGTKGKFKEEERLEFDGRVRAPKRHLMRRVVRWIHERSHSGCVILILAGGSLTKLLTHKIEGRTIFCELIPCRTTDPTVALSKYLHHIRVSISH